MRGVAATWRRGLWWEVWPSVGGVAAAGRRGHRWEAWASVGGVAAAGRRGHRWEAWASVVGKDDWSLHMGAAPALGPSSRA